MQAHSLFSAPGRRLPNLVPEYTKLFCSLLFTASRAVSYLSSLRNISHTFQGRLQPLHLRPLSSVWAADGEQMVLMGCLVTDKEEFSLS